MMYVVAYDIAADSRRSRLATLLQAWGYRVQESVFQVRVDAEDLSTLRSKILAIIDEHEDAVHMYRLCAKCEDHAKVFGIGIALDDIGLYRGVW